MRKQLSAKIDGRQMKDDLEIIDAILESRNIEDIGSFLHPNEEDMIPFEKLKNIDKAYQIIDDGITIGERFCVVWDEDNDGYMAGNIMTRYLKNAGADVSYFVHDRKEHGVENFDLSLLDNIDIMIIVDSLNNDPDVYRRIVDTDTALIVVDHHIPTRELLNSDVPFILVSSAVDYPNPELSGAGVTMKLVLYIDEMNLTDYAKDLWWCAASGIVGDVCSVIEPENRFIISKGLSQYQNPIVQKFIGNYLFNTEAIQFSISPLLNAAIRTRRNDVAAKMLLSESGDDISEFYTQLKECREEQNEIVNSMMPSLTKQIEAQLDKKFMVFHIDKTDTDITGLLGNKILAEVQRPLVVIKDEGDKWQGSMRATGLPNFMKMVNETGLARCDGHELAAGFECDKDKFDEFYNVIEEELKDIEFSIDVVADIELSSEQINENLIKQLAAINRISGKGFPPIKVLVRTDNYEISTFSTKKHLKIIDESGLLIVKWNTNDWQIMKNDKELVVVGTLSNPRYGRTQYLQLTIDEFTQQND